MRLNGVTNCGELKVRHLSLKNTQSDVTVMSSVYEYPSINGSTCANVLALLGKTSLTAGRVTNISELAHLKILMMTENLKPTLSDI